MVLAREILRQTQQAQIVLTSRRAAPEGALPEDLTRTRRIHVRTCDVTVRGDVQALVQGVRAEFGRLTGILHAAGATRDQFLIHKDDAALRETLGAKLRGAVYLDEASRECGLDFILFFSSLAGGFGNAGQADYALANAFMDG